MIDKFKRLFRLYREVDQEEKPYVAGRMGVLTGNYFLDIIERIFLVLLLIVGMYCTYDAVHIFYHSTNRVLGKQNKPEQIAAIKSLTDGYVAWLKIDDTSIDYPIMQGKDNYEFLTVSPYGDYSMSGSIFLDCNNNFAFTDEYNLIYGHHMAGGFMFGALDAYSDKNYLETHQSGTLQTDSGRVCQLKIFAFLHTEAEDENIFNAASRPFNFLQYVQANASVYLPDIYDGSQQVLALTTCKTTSSNSRTIVLAVMFERR